MRKLILLCMLGVSTIGLRAQVPSKPDPLELQLPARPRIDQLRILAELGACKAGESTQKEYIAALETKVREWQARALTAEARIKSEAKRVIPPPASPATAPQQK